MSRRTDGLPSALLPRSLGALAWLFCSLLLVPPLAVAAPLSFEGIGTGTNGPIHVTAGFAASGNLVTLILTNDGAPTASKAEVLTSFYMKIVTPTGLNPLTLTPHQGLGAAYQLAGNGSGTSDVAASWAVTSSGHYWRTPPDTAMASDLFAFKNFDQGWQAKQFTASGNGPQPRYNFGIGTVGNSGFAPDGVSLSFNGNVVKGPVYPGGTTVTTGTGTAVYPGVQQTGSNFSEINLGIYSVGKSGEPVLRDSSLLTNVLVRTSGTFVFDSSINFGTDGALLDAYVTDGVFAFGTSPDLAIPGIRHLPEPGTLPMVATFAAGAAGWSVWRRRARRRV